jgi:hypothetical protein
MQSILINMFRINKIAATLKDLLLGVFNQILRNRLWIYGYTLGHQLIYTVLYRYTVVRMGCWGGIDKDKGICNEKDQQKRARTGGQ